MHSYCTSNDKQIHSLLMHSLHSQRQHRCATFYSWQVLKIGLGGGSASEDAGVVGMVGRPEDPGAAAQPAALTRLFKEERLDFLLPVHTPAALYYVALCSSCVLRLFLLSHSLTIRIFVSLMRLA